jgi:hypothetical protein
VQALFFFVLVVFVTATPFQQSEDHDVAQTFGKAL